MVRGPLSAWRVLSTKGKRGYILYPSLRDGHADSAFGVGDVWAVRYRPRQDRDAKPDSGEDKAHIDPYVNRDSIKDTDVVLWYAAHARHDQHEDDIHDVHGHIVGPRLAPWKW
jgi:Cu2+-containing amine oxidase